MSKTAVIYWTGTGNTEAMANAIASGIGDADVMPVSEADASAVAQYDKICVRMPAMGDEVLEESEFEPFFADVEGSLPARRSRSSAPTAGATGSGCAIGRTVSPATGRSSLKRA